ncbi:thioesterase II family protein [Sphaerimonospora sp. CA-214678]|uniref:thioesterase II family protein n=1 Tax=Sphaerimonospora sp. CA-214678 TaxID=3240029 RepID=UPI003D8AA754
MKTEMGPATGHDWLRGYSPRPRATVRLICFPHAGGNAAFFRPWASLLAGHVELLAVQYPGRMDRASEPLVRRMTEMADRAALAVAPLARQGPVVLFGHSLGASVAHEVARRLAAGGTGPAALVVSGRPAPHRLRATTVHLADDDTLWAETGRLGGTQEDLLGSALLRHLSLPALRADYEVAETYRPGPAAPLPAPLLAFYGDRDPEVAEDEARDWSAWTSSGFTLTAFPGDHFYLVPERASVVKAITAGVAELASSPAPASG